MDKKDITILLVDDDRSTIESLSFIFKKQGYSLFKASNGREAIEIVKKNNIDIVLTDLMMPDIDGFELLKIIKTLNLNSTVIVMTAYGTLENAVSILKEGAEDFIVKPLKKAIVIQSVEKALQKRALLFENQQLKRKLKQLENRDIIGNAPKFRKVLDKLKIISKSPSTVHIYGESGTGKELIAREIYKYSNRPNKPFIAVNIAALPESIIESELFGYKKGAFTGAISDKRGYLQEADKGTLFLDEISELPLSIQVKLLRFLQEGEVTPIGSTTAQKIDTRVIVATNKDLSKMVNNNLFREDLYYRLNVIPIKLPPLRDRKEDIPLLVAHFIEKHQLKQNKNGIEITNEAINCLKGYRWPGNVRELENVIERLIVFSEGIIDFKDLPYEIMETVKQPEKNITIPIGTRMDEVEKMMIEKTLEFTKNDKDLAAKILGISARTIYRKLQ